MKHILLLFLTGILIAGCEPEDDKIHGYVEGKYIMIAPTSSGLLKTLSVERGQMVKVGDDLFSLDIADLESQYVIAQANMRKQELELSHAHTEQDRVLPLSKSGAISAAKLDDVKMRIDVIEASMESVKPVLLQVERKLRDAAPKSPIDGLVQNTYYDIGEYINQGQAVISLLAPKNIKIRFFVSQQKVSQISIGQSVTVNCDGCVAPIKAKISYIAPNSEYTPPVIFSVESREKLVFLIEAEPIDYQEFLRPGLPVSIDRF